MKAFFKYGLFFLIAFSSCRVDDPVNPDKSSQECKPFPSPPFGLSYERISIYPARGRATFNPDNSNEFAFIYSDERPSYYPLVVHNTSSGKSDTVVDQVWYPPSWSSSGWIVFSKGDNNIWKIKPDGTGLTQLTTGGYSYFPNCSPDGKRIVFVSDMGEPKYSSKIFTMDMNGGDTQRLAIPYGYQLPTWSPNGDLIAYTASDSIPWIYIYYMDYKRNVPVARFDKFDNITGIAWLDNHTLIACPRGKVYSIDLNSGVKTLIAKECHGEYAWPSVSANKKILLTRFDERYHGEDTLYGYTNLFIMNADGSGLEKVKF